MTHFARPIGNLDPGKLPWFCPTCDHSMMHHDGDGWTEHFACCEAGCDCAWEFDEFGVRHEVVQPPITPTSDGQS